MRPVQRLKSIAEEVADRIGSAIVDGDPRRGQSSSERRLAEKLKA